MLITLDAGGLVTAVNDHYLQLTGHRHDDVLGRSFWDELLSVGSRVFFHTQLSPVLQLDGRLVDVMVDLRTAGHRRIPALMNATRTMAADGSAGGGTVIALMSAQERRVFEDRLRQARDAAEQARHESEEARADTESALAESAHVRRRLELLAQVNAALASNREVDLALSRLANVLAHRLADWCIVYLPDDDQAALVRRSAAHTDPDRQSDLELLAELLPGHAQPRSSLADVIRGGPPALIAFVDDTQEQEPTTSTRVRDLYSRVGLSSALVIPATVRHTRVATVVLGRGEQRAPFDDDDFADVTDVAARAAIVIDNLRRQAREHSNSMALQHALLTTPPASPRFEIATRYLPATNGNEIGGDWYDALLRRDGSPLVVIGDVVGHDIHAAAAMGQLRGILRTVAYTTSAAPAEILSQTDAAARGLGVDVLASVIVAQVKADPDGGAVLTWSNAGHPPPLLITSTGIEILSGDPERLLGLALTLDRPRHSHRRPIEPGETLVLYTDGLIERRDASLDQNLANLIGDLGDVHAMDLDQLCDLILQCGNGSNDDDVALLALRVNHRT